MSFLLVFPTTPVFCTKITGIPHVHVYSKTQKETSILKCVKHVYTEMFTNVSTGAGANLLLYFPYSFRS